MTSWIWKSASVMLLAIGGIAMPSIGAAPSGLPGAYDPDNILAKTARGEIPSAKLYEDAHILAFLGDRPQSRGHFLVISKRSKATNFLDIEPDELNRMMAVAQKVARAEVKAIGADGFTLRQNNGSASTIDQVHFHVIPRFRNAPLDETKRPPVSIAELQPLADEIRKAMQ